jgi:Pretoxin HINT domain/Pre-toxin TG
VVGSSSASSVSAPVGTVPVSSPNLVKPPVGTVASSSNKPTIGTRGVVVAFDYINASGFCVEDDEIGVKNGANVLSCDTDDLEKEAARLEEAARNAADDKRRAELEFQAALKLAQIQDTKFYSRTGESAEKHICDIVKTDFYKGFNGTQKFMLWKSIGQGLRTGNLGGRALGGLALIFKNLTRGGQLTVTQVFQQQLNNMIRLDNPNRSNNAQGANGLGVKDLASIALGFTPAGDVLAVMGAITGVDPITGKSLEGLERWAGLLGLIALGGEAVAIAKGANAAARAARGENAVSRGADLANCANSFSASTKVWVARATNETSKKAKSMLEKTKTIAKTALAAVAISSIGIGTQVLAHNEQTKLESPQTVTATHEHTDPIIVTLKLETSDKKFETITTTPEHSFYALLEPSKTANGLWVNAGELKNGNWLRRANGETGLVKQVSFEAKSQKMYNLTVAQDHTFFVGDGQWLVHNCDEFGKLLDDYLNPDDIAAKKNAGSNKLPEPKAGFDWDDSVGSNVDHVAAHGVGQSNWEAAYRDPSRQPFPANPPNQAYLSRNQNGEPLVVVFRVNSDGSIRPVTAYVPGKR